MKITLPKLRENRKWLKEHNYIGSTNPVETLAMIYVLFQTIPDGEFAGHKNEHLINDAFCNLQDALDNVIASLEDEIERPR
jgi:hypothetical protein